MNVDLQRDQDPAAIIVTMVAEEAGNETVIEIGARTEGTRGDVSEILATQVEVIRAVGVYDLTKEGRRRG